MEPVSGGNCVFQLVRCAGKLKKKVLKVFNESADNRLENKNLEMEENNGKDKLVY